MATLTPDSYSDSDSDTDSYGDSDYGYDLTAEEEAAVANLVARASSKAAGPVLIASTASRSTVANPSLEVDVNAAVFAHASDGSRAREDRTVGRANHDGDFTYHNQPGVPSALARGAKRLASTTASHDASLAIVVDRPKPRSVPTLATTDDLRYPDLSSALADALDTPAVDARARSERAPLPNDATGSPLGRFRSFPKKPFSVSDLTAGAWCELQYYYTLTKLPGGRKTRTAAMKGGTKLHKQLEEEVYTTVKIDITKKEDAFGLKLWNIIQGLRTLRDTGMTRELEIWGIVDGTVVNGVIDGLTHENPDPDFEEEIRSSQGSQNSQPAQEQQKITSFFGSGRDKSPQVYLFDVKTRGSKTLPTGAAVRPTKIQLYLYHRFLANMAAGKLDFPQVFSRYGLSLDEPFSDTFVAQIGTLHDEIFDDAASSALSSALSKKSSSDYESAPSTPPGAFGLDLASSPPPDLIHYRTLRALLPLLQSELQLTFPRGADSLGTLVTVEYRRRARPPAEADGDGMNGDGNESEGDAGGEIIGQNVFYVDDGVLDQYLAKDMEWWRGGREPQGVVIEEAYKCRSCEFADACDWRRDQESELLRLARARRGKRKA